MNFHSSYSELLKKLPLSIKKNIWNCLISRLRNPLTKEQASSINPDIEVLLISEIDKYEKKKNQCHISETSITNSSIQNTEIDIEKEINTRVKEATDTMHQKFVESTRKQLEVIRNKNKDLLNSILETCIRSRDIYTLIHELEVKDGKSYSNISK